MSDERSETECSTPGKTRMRNCQVLGVLFSMSDQEVPHLCETFVVFGEKQLVFRHISNASTVLSFRSFSQNCWRL